MENCIFCKIINKKIPGKIVYEDNEILAFEDVNPQAPVHILVIPKKHISTILDITLDDSEIIYKIHKIINELAQRTGCAEKGFRIVTNCNMDGGQAVYHIHFHLLGGRKMTWPPG
ncbi:MAG: histidine triad nucleotide-binding protein [Candidatus Firestonebacteria bacterium]|nr:histidine triad nucleotide-binding protein [Candidatus Firestonebacteria bacterium]